MVMPQGSLAYCNLGLYLRDQKHYLYMQELAIEPSTNSLTGSDLLIYFNFRLDKWHPFVEFSEFLSFYPKQLANLC